MSSFTTSAGAKHPYYPLDAHLPGFLANDSSLQELLLIAVPGCTILLAASLIVARIFNPGLKTVEQLTVLWFVLSGFLHTCFEGYYVLHNSTLISQQSFFGQLWKEYGLSDSRYLSQDPFVLCIESVTVIILGPLCFAAAALIVQAHPMRHPLQVVVSVVHIYSDILYFVTSSYAHYSLGIAYSRPEAMYFWIYYVFLNMLWIVIPGFLLLQSFRTLGTTVKISQSMRKGATKQMIK